ncbi:LamG-like jellyroll fold domain-containing protein [Muricoccus vinaceus]|uniref:LamG-like jellyroll fold domain-containing protein n=1 Tax=Muricoccus vinaceus TaxID=424704 RepID=A0ABV6IL86_9PROT
MPIYGAHRYGFTHARERAPEGPVEIIPGGASVLFWPGAGGGVLGRASRVFTTAVPPMVRPGLCGLCWDFAGNTYGTGNHRIGAQLNRSAQAESSWEALVRWRNVSVNNVLAVMSNGTDGTSSTKDHTLGGTTTNAPYYSVWDGSSRQAQGPDNMFADGDIVHLVGVSRFTAVTLYVNGIETAKTGSANPGEFYNPHYAVIGGANAVNFQGEVYYVAWYDRQLSPAEIGARCADPFGLLVRSGR